MLCIYVPSVLFMIYYLFPFFQAISDGQIDMKMLTNLSNFSVLSNTVNEIGINVYQSGRGYLVGIMLFIHFFKRVLETLFLHNYSSKQTEGGVGVTIGVYYALTCWLITNVTVS